MWCVRLTVNVVGAKVAKTSHIYKNTLCFPRGNRIKNSYLRVETVIALRLFLNL